MIQGPNGKIWVSGYQLVGIAKQYAKEQKLEFDFEDTETNVWINPGRRIRVDVNFSSGMGKPFLDVAIDKHGKAVSHLKGTAICGTSMQ